MSDPSLRAWDGDRRCRHRAACRFTHSTFSTFELQPTVARAARMRNQSLQVVSFGGLGATPPAVACQCRVRADLRPVDCPKAAKALA